MILEGETKSNIQSTNHDCQRREEKLITELRFDVSIDILVPMVCTISP